MLALPVKFQKALDDGNLEPVVTAELTTEFTDIPFDQQTQFTDATSNINNTDPKNVILNYPSVAGDLTPTSVLISQGFGHQKINASFGHVAQELPILRAFAFSNESRIINSAHALQTFSVGDSDNQATRLKAIKVTLSKAHDVTLWTVAAKVFSVSGNGVLVGLGGQELNTMFDIVFGDGIGIASNEISIASIPTSPLPASDHTFNFDIDLKAGQRYAVVLFFKLSAGAVVTRLPGLFWHGTTDDLPAGEFGSATFKSPSAGSLSLQVDVASFSNHPANRPWIEYRLDARSVPTSAGNWGFQFLTPSAFDPSSLVTGITAVKFQAWAGATLGAKTTPLTGSKGDSRIFDGDKITVLSRFYVVRATLIVELDPDHTDNNPKNTTTLIRTPSVKKIDAIFPKTVIFSSHNLPFSTATAIDKSPSVPTKLNPRNTVTERGSFSLSLSHTIDEVSEVLKRVNLLGLPVEIRIGHLPTATVITDLAVFATGKVVDYSHQELLTTLNIQDRTKDLDIKFPTPPRPSQSKTSQVWRVDDSASNFTNETSDFNSDVLGDVLPFPATEAIADYFAIGNSSQFSGVRFSVGTAGAGGVVVWEYWNGTIWTALASVVDESSGFTAAGTRDLTFTVPFDWTPRSLGGSESFLYIRARLTTVYSTNPIIDKGLLTGVDVKSFETTENLILRADFQHIELVKVVEDIITNQAFIPRKFVDSDAFELLRTTIRGSDSPSKWVSARVINKQEEAKKAVQELMELIGAFLVVLEDGKLRPIQFPRSDTSKALWDEDILSRDDKQASGFSKTIINQAFVLFDRDSNDKFDGVGGFIDLEAQDDWAPGSELFVSDKVIKSKWLGAEALFNGFTTAGRIAKRIVDAHKNGLVAYSCRTGVDQFAIQVGDYVDVTSPVFLKKFNLGSKARQFMISSKDVKIDSGFIDWGLIEAVTSNRKPTAIPLVSMSAFPLALSLGATTGAVTTGEGVKFSKHDTLLIGTETLVVKITGVSGDVLTWDTGIAQAQTAGALAYSDGVIEGSPTLNVAVTGKGSVDPDGTILNYEWDKDYDGVNFQTDLTGVTPTETLSYTATQTGVKTIALRVTDDNGAQHINTVRVRVRAAPVAVINYSVSAPDQPLSVSLSSGSFGITGAIIKSEWDLSFDGATFNSEVLGESTSINLPLQTVRVALKVTDEDGLTNQTDLTFNGKALLPANVTGFAGSLDRSGILLSWTQNSDADIAEYIIKEGTVWSSGTLITRTSSTTFTIGGSGVAASTKNYMIKAVNTTQRESGTEASISVVISVGVPTSLVLSSGTAQLFVKKDGTIVSRLLATWTDSINPFAKEYDIQFKKSADVNWEPAGIVLQGVQRIFIWDVEDDVNYDVRLRTVALSGFVSAFVSSINHSVVGKTQPPADVTGFFVDQARDRLVFNWDTNVEADIFGYEIRKGTTWNTSTILQTDILANHFMTQSPPTAGTQTYLIKALDRSRIFSVNAASVVITTFDTKDRNLVVTADRKADQFPAGVLTNILRDRGLGDADQKLWIASTGDLVQDATFTVSSQNTKALVLRGTLGVTGSYEGPPVDAASVIDTARFDIQTVSEIIPDPVGTTMKVEYAQSDDGISYTPFAAIRQGERSGRFWKEKITLTNDDGASNIALTQSILTLDAVDIFERQDNVTIAIGGTTVTFVKKFNVIPTITGYTIAGSVGAWLETVSKTKTSMTVKIRSTSNSTDIGGVLDFGIQGY